MNEARLVLEDSTVFRGKSFGAVGEIGGEMVFNTGMTGYQEVLTDPSYSGQIIIMTYPLIGNYGINADDCESAYPLASGFVVKEYCDHPSNWRSQENIDSFLKHHNIIGICNIDTRALTKRLRNQGTIYGLISTDSEADEVLVAKCRKQAALPAADFVKMAATDRIYTQGTGEKHLVLMDFGAKGHILRYLLKLGCKVTIVPATTDSKQIMELKPDGIVLSNGPGDPKVVSYAVKTIKELFTEKTPMFGICLGHQLLALALGGDTYKLKFGHRGGNHPVKNLLTGQITITSQNHGYAVRQESFADRDVIISHVNVNDGTVEGIKHCKLPVFSVQYHPEAAPGPLDSEGLFGEFFKMI